MQCVNELMVYMSLYIFKSKHIFCSCNEAVGTRAGLPLVTIMVTRMGVTIRVKRES